MELLSSIVVICASVVMLVVFIAMLFFAVAIAKLVDTVHAQHLADMRDHLRRTLDQVLAISEANLTEIEGRRHSEIERVRAQGRETEDLLAKAAGVGPRVDHVPEFDLEHTMGGDQQ